MEIEEQYDSTNPKNCYKIIRKQGQAPQIESGEQQNSQIESNKTEEQLQQPLQNIQNKKLGNGLDEKFDQLCKMSGKSPSELESFVVENKDLTIGQLYDKALEQKII